MKCLPGCSSCCKVSIIRFFRHDLDVLIRTLGLPLPKPNFEDALNVAFRGCPFLVDDRCSIYALRPGFCRAYPVTESDGKICVTMACPSVASMTRRDVALAKQELGKYLGISIKAKNRFIATHSRAEFNRLNASFLRYVASLDEDDPDDACVLVTLEEFDAELRDQAGFQRFIAMKRRAQERVESSKRRKAEVRGTDTDLIGPDLGGEST